MARRVRASSSGTPADEDDRDADPVEVAREIALRRLTHRAHSKAELASALAARHVPLEAAEQVLERFEEVGLLDDAGFSAAWAESRHRTKNLAPRAIAMELRRKGVSDEDINAALDPIDDDDQHAAALRVAQHKWRQVRGLERNVAYRRLAGAVARKGFSSHIVAAVVAEVMQPGGEAEE